MDVELTLDRERFMGEQSRNELLAALDEAAADLKAGPYDHYTDETLPALADELKREARLFGRP